jgi:hypothetical protein
MSVTPTAGALAVRMPATADLCGDCSNAFMGWMKTNGTNTQPMKGE